MSSIVFLVWLGLGIFFILRANERGYFKTTPLRAEIPVILLAGSFLLYFALTIFASFFLSIFQLKGEVIHFFFSLLLSGSLLILAHFYLPRETLNKVLGFKKSFFKNMAIGILAWLIIFPFIFLLSQFIDSLLSYFFKIKNLPDQIAVEYMKNALKSPSTFILALFSTLIFAPLIEEYLFRGLLQNFFKKYLSCPKAIICSSLIFAVFHFAPGQKAANLTIVSCLFLFSLALGFLYEKYKTLWVPIVLHATFNFLSILNLLFFMK